MVLTMVGGRLLDYRHTLRDHVWFYIKNVRKVVTIEVQLETDIDISNNVNGLRINAAPMMRNYARQAR